PFGVCTVRSAEGNAGPTCGLATTVGPPTCGGVYCCPGPRPWPAHADMRPTDATNSQRETICFVVPHMLTPCFIEPELSLCDQLRRGHPTSLRPVLGPHDNNAAGLSRAGCLARTTSILDK